MNDMKDHLQGGMKVLKGDRPEKALARKKELKRQVESIPDGPEEFKDLKKKFQDHFREFEIYHQLLTKKSGETHENNGELANK